MRTSVRRIAVGIGTIAAVASPLFTTPSAQAAQSAQVTQATLAERTVQAPRNPYTPQRVCGRGYYVVKDRGGKAKRAIKKGKRTYGHVYLLYSNRTKKNCVVAIKSAYVGKRTPMSATLAVRNGRTATDNGRFAYYAGPVTLKSAGKCVKYKGSMRLSNGKWATGGRTTWGNCRR